MDEITESEVYLNRVYNAEDPDRLIEIYDEWAGDYDNQLASLGYRHPAVLAGMVGRHLKPNDGVILDAAAGTGLIGAALFPLGYRALIAIDISPGMLKVAAEKSVYQDCREMVLGERLDFADDSMQAVVAAGVFTPGHAPPSCLDELCRVTRPGGFIIATISKPAFADGGYGEKISQILKDNRITRANETTDYISMPGSPNHNNAAARVYALQVT